MAISVIIPTYKEPDHLKLCIESALRTMTNQDNEILVYVDGTLDINRNVIESFSKEKEEGYNPVSFICMSENRGMCVGMNYLIARARHKACLVVNDDHVFPKDWDQVLEEFVGLHRILIPGVIERKPSIFPDVVQQDFGQYPETFEMDRFLEESHKSELGPEVRKGMSSLPFLVNKYEYLGLGGWDERCLHGLQADHDFFLRAKLLGITTVFVPSLRFYHFSMTSVNNDSLVINGKQKRTEAEQQNLRYLYEKWGGRVPRHNGRVVELWDPIYHQTIHI